MHPQAKSPAADLQASAAKVKAGANSAITQYFYNADAYFLFVEEADALGVTVPTATKPKPIAASPSMQRAFLSSPAARPTRLGNFRPASCTGSRTRLPPWSRARAVPRGAASSAAVGGWGGAGDALRLVGRESDHGESARRAVRQRKRAVDGVQPDPAIERPERAQAARDRGISC